MACSTRWGDFERTQTALLDGGTGSDAASTSSTSSTSTVPTEPCGGTNVLSDNFPGSDPGALWQTSVSGGATVAETGNAAVVTLPSGQPGGSFGSFKTSRYYNLLKNTVSVEVASAGNTATTARAGFGVSDPVGDTIWIAQRNGTISFGWCIDGGPAFCDTITSTVYSPTSHLYWRFREDGGSTYWQTSSDGAVWITQAQMTTASLFSLDLVRVGFSGSTLGGEVSPGSVSFAKVNGGGTPTGRWCPVSSITDAFQSASQSPIWARSWTTSPEVAYQGGGFLTFRLAANAVADAAYYSAASFDLTGSALFVQVPEAGITGSTLSGNVQTWLSLDTHAGGLNQITMISRAGQLNAELTVAGNRQVVASIGYEPWWRIRESGGVLYWETAPDGLRWSVQAQVKSLPFAIDALDVDIGSGTYQAGAGTATSEFANCNLPPP